MGLFFTSKPPVSKDSKKIDELLSRATENVIPRDLALKKLYSGERLRVYFGIDPTGAKLHLGHSVPLRKLKQFADLGHHVIFLVGSFTAMIGDPSGRDAMREPLTPLQVKENFYTYKRQAQKILDFSKVEVRYNDEWLSKLGFADIVKLASSFTVGQMLKRDMFEKRIKEDKPIGLHEFLYPLMVGYDSVILDVDVELGGSDQEFNMLAGRHMQEVAGKRDKFVLTTKLIEGTDGRKMSKTYNNAVYIEDAPNDMYGKIMSVKDELVATYFEAATEVPIHEVEKILKGHPKEAKMHLAKEIVSMYHGAGAAKKAEENFINTFVKREMPTDVPEVEPAANFRETLLKNNIISSNSEFARLADAGAIRLIKAGGEVKIESPNAPMVPGSIFRIGKHRLLKIK